uniref:Uncharacterized protein n=1 Tax=Timema poppense TaxID=170557 RepID=A0A7R9CPJ5_TIMPO|nr:unnamed protein product [Timema poppensis]
MYLGTFQHLYNADYSKSISPAIKKLEPQSSWDASSVPQDFLRSKTAHRKTSEAEACKPRTPGAQTLLVCPHMQISSPSWQTSTNFHWRTKQKVPVSIPMSSSLSGAILLVGQVADALATPFVGIHSDKDDDFWLCRYGRRKTWHLLGTLCVLASFPFIFSPCLNCEHSHHIAQLVYYSAFVIIFQFGWASVQISHLSLIPDLTPSEHERTGLISIRLDKAKQQRRSSFHRRHLSFPNYPLPPTVTSCCRDCSCTSHRDFVLPGLFLHLPPRLCVAGTVPAPPTATSCCRDSVLSPSNLFILSDATEVITSSGRGEPHSFPAGRGSSPEQSVGRKLRSVSCASWRVEVRARALVLGVHQGSAARWWLRRLKHHGYPYFFLVKSSEALPAVPPSSDYRIIGGRKLWTGQFIPAGLIKFGNVHKKGEDRVEVSEITLADN